MAAPHELPSGGPCDDASSGRTSVGGTAPRARVTASAGTAAVGPADADGGPLGDADAASYAAKRGGGGRCVAYEPGLRSAARERADLRRGVRDLLSTPAGEPSPAGRLVVRYQPVVAVHDEEPLGVEALVRWAHPDLGELAPDAFLPLVEAAGLGAELDRRVLEEALLQVAAWDALGITVHRVGVNLGAGSAASPTLAQDVLDACARTGVGPDRLLLEVTEHEELRADGPAGPALARLAAAGASVALDDFGAGYAGVGPLLHLPVALLKLDRSLLPLRRERLPGAADPVEVLTGVLALAAAVGLEVTAEGVETPDQLALLRSLGVRHAQGWLFARALDPAGVVAHWRAGARTPVASAG